MRSREEIEKDVVRCFNSVEDLFMEVLLDIRAQNEKLIQLLEPSELPSPGPPAGFWRRSRIWK